MELLVTSNQTHIFINFKADHSFLLLQIFNYLGKEVWHKTYSNMDKEYLNERIKIIKSELKSSGKHYISLVSNSDKEIKTIVI